MSESPSTHPVTGEVDAYYDAERREYLLKNQRGVWLPLTEAQFKRHLRDRGISTEKQDWETMSAADRVILHLQHTRDIDYAGKLCGKNEGFYVEGQTRFLVTSSFHLSAPVAGDWSTIRAILHGLLVENEPAHGDRQCDTFHGWMRAAQVSLRAGKIQAAQALAVAGPAGCGKSLLQSLITPCLGGRVAKPSRYMNGGTDFNGKLFEAEHLALEDEFMSHRISDRLRLGAALKNFCVSTRAQSCHRKNRQAITLPAWWRVSITLNDDPEAMMVLPPLDEHIQDKLILLRASRFTFPLPMGTTDEQDRLWQLLVSEVPAYLRWLLHDFVLPAECEDLRRYVVATWHHPELRAALENLSPESDLLALMDEVLWKCDARQWRGTSEELQRLLCNDLNTGHSARKLLEGWRNACGTYLGRLAAKQPARVKEARTATRREFAVFPPAD
ncbi:MAG: hypothetical protein ACKV19_20495 [Verrucomicrobiales bacterium]